jgi:hypothetical protein
MTFVYFLNFYLVTRVLLIRRCGVGVGGVDDEEGIFCAQVVSPPDTSPSTVGTIIAN